MSQPPKRPYLFPSFEDALGSTLLSPERVATLRAEVEARISTPFTKGGHPITTAAVADLSLPGEPPRLMLYPRMDHDPEGRYMRREVLAALLTDAEIELLNRSAHRAANRRRDEERFAKATKVKAADWSGWVTDGDTYHDSIEAFYDHWRDLVGDGEMGYNDHPAYVWAAKPQQVIPHLDVADITEHWVCDRGYEDMDLDDLDGVPTLQAALDAFVKENETVVSYTPDYGTAILIGSELTEELADIECNNTGIHPIHQR